MTDAPIVPRPDQAVSPGIERLAALRPGALPFATAGRYGDVFYGWRGQLAQIIQRLVHEIEASRLETATGDALRDLCASEFDTVLPTGPLTAVGDASLSRPSGGLAGVIPAGTRFQRAAKADPLLLRTQASFVSTIDVVVPQGATTAQVPLQATRSGAFANTPTGVSAGASFKFNLGVTDIQPADTLFDPGLTLVRASSAGGSDGASDTLLKAAAMAYAVGRYAPTLGAVTAAALLAGAVNVAVFEDPAAACTYILCRDVSWATTPSWENQLQVAVDAEGFGCRAKVLGGASAFVRVAASIVLRSKSALVDTSAVAQAVTSAATAYFNSRPDWYTWRTAGLKAALTRAHPSIKACTSVTVLDASSGAALPDPAATPDFGGLVGPVNWTLVPGAAQATFTA